MTAAPEVAAMKARHEERLSGFTTAHQCAYDYQPWPCDAARLIAFTEGVLALPDCTCEYSAALDTYTEAPGCQHGIWHVEDLAALAKLHFRGER